MFKCKVKQLNSEMPFLAYLFIYFYTFSNHITFPMLPRPIHHPHKRKNPGPEIPLNLRAGISYSYLPAYLSEAWYSVIYPAPGI